MRVLPLVSEVTSSQNVNSSNNVTGGGVDYDSGPYDVTFRTGETRALFEIPITDDNTLELDETFTLNIDPSSIPTQVTVGGTGASTVTITNDDSKLSLLSFVPCC